MLLGVESLLASESLIAELKGKRVGLLCHPASVNQQLQHSLELLVNHPDIDVTCAFGPQHGIHAEKQDNMIESDDFQHPKYNIPVFSLYGAFRRPTKKMLNELDVLLVDLQDVGCRIYTYLTTLIYCLEECDQYDKELWVLDRPNPAGRPIEGTYLQSEFETFVGAAELPMRHGLTLGEAANWYKAQKELDLDLKVVNMQGYQPNLVNEWGWPKSLTWVNPSPNMPRLSCAYMYTGTVLLEGTMLSEGRGTTLPLEMFGAPGMDGEKIYQRMLEIAPNWMSSCKIRPCFFEPTFHKFKQQVCGGLQIHVDHPEFDFENFKPYRIIAVYLRAVRELYPEFELWRQPPYEYEDTLMPFDMLSGSDFLRKWVDDGKAEVTSLDETLIADEQAWQKERSRFLIY